MGAGRTARAALIAAFLAGIMAIAVVFYRQEDALGRFAPLPPRDSIDEAWLREHVFSMLPEEVGAAWDNTTSAPEVAAVLARMVSEKKLASEVYRTKRFLSSSENLRLKLLVPRGSLKGYERTLVDSLFVSGEVTDTEKIRVHYRSRGFDPASKLESHLTRRVKTLLGTGGTRKISKKPALYLLLASMVCFAIALPEFPRFLFPIFLGGILYVVAVIPAVVYRTRVERLFAFALSFLVPAALLAAAASYFLFFNTQRHGAFALAGIALFYLALLVSVFNKAKFRDGASAIALRKKLAAARRYFVSELAKRAPELKDEWFPYLLAFELGPDVSKWFRVHGTEGSSKSSDFGSSGTSSGSGSTGSGSGGFTGGGGAFGGAGATASWATAVGSVASGVAAPSSSGSSSSSGGGGGGGGGGSSGGGGGGGW
jgi:uncharacterized membrane protein YgcG